MTEGITSLPKSWLERASFDVERLDDRVEIRRCAQREAGMIGEESRAFRCCALGSRDRAHLGQRTELLQLFASCRGDREVYHRRDDLIELQRAECVAVHR